MRINDRCFVDVKVFSEALGIGCKQVDETKIKLLKNDAEIIFGNDSTKAYVSGKEFDLDVHSVFVSDTVMVPVRAVSELFGYEVNWKDAESIVDIISQN